MNKRADTDLEFDEKLKEAIQNVKVEIKLSDGILKDIEARYIGWNIMRGNLKLREHIFQLLGEGPIRIDPWENKTHIRSAAKNAGLMLVKNKHRGTYGLINRGKETSADNSYVFNTDLLDMIDADESDKDEKAGEIKST